jgi:hypothetical protein
MCGVLELDHHKDRMANNCPEAWAFSMALDILEYSNNHIRRQGNVRMLVCPPNSEHAIASHVIDLLVAFSFSERVGHIVVP